MKNFIRSAGYEIEALAGNFLPAKKFCKPAKVVKVFPRPAKAMSYLAVSSHYQDSPPPFNKKSNIHSGVDPAVDGLRKMSARKNISLRSGFAKNICT